MQASLFYIISNSYSRMAPGEDDKGVDAYSTDGRFLPEEYLVTFTPEVHLWLNSRSGKNIHRKTFFKKVEHLLEDLKRNGRPVRAHAKVIRKVEVPVFYIRLENNQGLRILFDYSIDADHIDVRILAVSNKKEFQDKLRRSAEPSFTPRHLIDWMGRLQKTLDLEKCTDKELEKLKDEARFIFSKLPKQQRLVRRNILSTTEEQQSMILEFQTLLTIAS